MHPPGQFFLGANFFIGTPWMRNEGVLKTNFGLGYVKLHCLMTNKFHNQKQQANPLQREEEVQNTDSHTTSRIKLSKAAISVFLGYLTYQSPLILTELFQHNLINVSYLRSCYLYQVMMTLHFLNDVANDAESTQK